MNEPTEQQISTLPEWAQQHIRNQQHQLHLLRASCDPYNGDRPQWCGDCGAPIEAVRPGKAQCWRCENYDFLKAEFDRLHPNPSEA